MEQINKNQKRINEVSAVENQGITDSQRTQEQVPQIGGVAENEHPTHPEDLNPQTPAERGFFISDAQEGYRYFYRISQGRSMEIPSVSVLNRENHYAHQR
jgi:hypothetical protein